MNTIQKITLELSKQQSEEFFLLFRKISAQLESMNNSQAQVSNEDEELLNIKQVCEIFKVSRSTIYGWRLEGYIKAYSIASRIYFKKSEVLSALRKAGIK